MELYSVLDKEFRKYGSVLQGYDFTGMLKAMRHTPITKEVVYIPVVEELETLDAAKQLQNKGFGGMPLQIGYC